MKLSELKSSNSFETQSIAVKFRILFGVLTGVALLIAACAWGGYWWISSTTSESLTFSRGTDQVGRAASKLQDSQAHLLRLAQNGQASELAEARQSATAAVENLAAARSSLTDVSSRNLAEFDRLANEVGVLQSRLAGADQANFDAAIANETARQIEQANALRNKLDQELPEFVSYSDTGVMLAMVIMTLLVLYALWNWRAANRHCRKAVTNPIEEITQSMLLLADGEKEIAIPWVERHDEIGDMARSLEVFRRGYLKLDRMRNEATEKAAQELEAQRQHEAEREDMRQQREDMLVELANRFEKTVGDVVGGVAAASTQLQVTATSMAATAEQSAMQTSDVSSALSEASSGVTAAAAASDEFAMSIGEISRQAATSAELARVASNSAANADSTISALNNSAAQVGQIVELISSIAQRTNLLALNASIEAARGGEAGRGFAVVASEVKELAAQTSKATDEVAKQIRAIQDSTTASVSALRSIGQQIEQLEATSVSIAAAVDQQSIAGQDLARSIDLAARSTDDVSSNIVHVRESTLATGAAASQVLSSSNELEHQAAVLKSQVSEFLTHVRAA